MGIFPHKVKDIILREVRLNPYEGQGQGQQGPDGVNSLGARWWGLGYWGEGTGDRGTGVGVGVGYQT